MRYDTHKLPVLRHIILLLSLNAVRPVAETGIVPHQGWEERPSQEAVEH